ncbi:sigma-70 family RNA polymerase sigma factor [Ornithinibacillus salinisoli]|uniref:Sigma-70 family RNA polymerase sigma factor n=1 Tax=Ornithinibacillus salinisoli TaxID=1848459 RepID=A0ABW4VXF3_9BACI
MRNKLRIVSDDFLEDQNNFTEEQLQELYPILRRYCQFISQNSWDGEDLVQESLLKAWQHYRNHPEIPKALLKKIAHNSWIDTIRSRSKESLEDIPDYVIDESKVFEDRLEAVQGILNILTPKQAVMFTLKEGFQFQSSEIAELLNTTETAVKSTIYRAKQRIEKQELNEACPIMDQYWDLEEQEQIEQLLHESLITQDPAILIRAIPSIHSLRKDINPTCSIRKLGHFNVPSSSVYMAA